MAPGNATEEQLALQFCFLFFKKKTPVKLTLQEGGAAQWTMEGRRKGIRAWTQIIEGMGEGAGTGAAS